MNLSAEFRALLRVSILNVHHEVKYDGGNALSFTFNVDIRHVSRDQLKDSPTFVAQPQKRCRPLEVKLCSMRFVDDELLVGQGVQLPRVQT